MRISVRHLQQGGVGGTRDTVNAPKVDKAGSSVLTSSCNPKSYVVGRKDTFPTQSMTIVVQTLHYS